MVWNFLVNRVNSVWRNPSKYYRGLRELWKGAKSVYRRGRRWLGFRSGKNSVRAAGRNRNRQAPRRNFRRR